MLVDTHAHLYWDLYTLDFDGVIQQAVEKNLGLIINIGTNLQTSKQAIELESEKIKFYATVGLHPHDIEEYQSSESIHKLIGNLESLHKENPKKVIGLGECGLDYFFHPDHLPTISPDRTKQLQLNLYRSQINLAKKLGLPLIIHCREAWEDIFLPELNGTAGLFHNFSGNDSDVKQALELGYYLSFSCILTYPKNQPLRDLVKKLPLDKILTETDCPFLPPQFIRGERNEPAHIAEVVKVISEVKGLSEMEVASRIYKNTQELFKI